MQLHCAAIFIGVLLACLKAEAMEFDKFMSTLSKSSLDDDNEKTEDAPQVTDEQVVNFMKRSGLLPQQADALDNNQKLLLALQALKRQQNLSPYQPDYLTQANIQSPQVVGQPSSSQSQMIGLARPSLSMASLQKSPRDFNPVQSLSEKSGKPLYAPAYSESAGTQRAHRQNGDEAYAPIDNGQANKADRQGHYDYEEHPHSRTPVSYASEHHPPAHNYGLNLPIPSFQIKFDPFRLLKLLLSGIPRPLLNFNGKVFLGVELGKGVGFNVKPPAVSGHFGGGHTGGHYPGGGTSITIG